MSRYEWGRLNLHPLGGLSYFERGSRATAVGTPQAYARTWVVGYGAGRGQSVMLREAPQQVKTVARLPIMYCDAFGYYVGDYPGEFDTLGQAEQYAALVAGAEEAGGSPSLLALLALLLLVI